MPDVEAPAAAPAAAEAPSSAPSLNSFETMSTSYSGARVADVSPVTTPIPVAAEVAAPIPEPVKAAEPAKVEEAKAEKEPVMSRQFAALAEKERQLTAKEKRVAEAEKKAAEIQAAWDKAIDDPDALLEKAGWDYEKLLERKIKGSNPEDMKLKALEVKTTKQLDELKSAQEKFQKDQLDAKQAADAARYQANVKELVLKDPRFEAIREAGEVDKVWDTMVEVFKLTGKAPEPTEVAGAIELQLETQTVKLAKIEKIAKQLRAAGVAPAEAKAAATAAVAAPAPAPVKATPVAQEVDPLAATVEEFKNARAFRGLGTNVVRTGGGVPKTETRDQMLERLAKEISASR